MAGGLVWDPGFVASLAYNQAIEISLYDFYPLKFHNGRLRSSAFHTSFWGRNGLRAANGDKITSMGLRHVVL